MAYCKKCGEPYLSERPKMHRCKPKPVEPEPEGLWWFSGFMRSNAEMPVDDELAPTARVHVEQQQLGKLIVCSYDVTTALATTVDEMRTLKNDEHLLRAAGTYEVDFGPDAWFTLFSKPVPVPGMDGRKVPPLVAMVWSPPDEVAFIDHSGDTAFVQWPRFTTAAELVQRSESYSKLAHWFLAGVIHRSAWLSNNYAFEQLVDPEVVNNVEQLPAGGIWLATMNMNNAIFVDADTQLRR